MTKVKQLQNLIKNKPHLIWYTTDYDKLSEEAVLESVLNYGNWGDFISLEKILGVKKTDSLFRKIKNKERTNLRPQTINYFTKYFEKYA